MRIGLLLRWLINSIAIVFTSYIVTGIEVSGVLPALVAGLVLGFLNSFLRPIMIIFTIPLSVMTFGLFILLINGFLLKLTASLIKGFEVHGFWSAMFGTIIISFVSWLLSSFVDDNGRIVYIVNIRKEK